MLRAWIEQLQRDLALEAEAIEGNPGIARGQVIERLHELAQRELPAGEEALSAGKGEPMIQLSGVVTEIRFALFDEDRKWVMVSIEGVHTIRVPIDQAPRVGEAVRLALTTAS